MRELIESSYRFSIGGVVPLIQRAPQIVSTHIRGRIASESWPLSATFLLPMMEQVSAVSTPPSFLPAVASFYNYIRVVDDFFDTRSSFPTFQETIDMTQGNLDDFIEQTVQSGSEIDMLYLQKIIANLQKTAYQALSKQNTWTTSPSFGQAYGYRWDTTGSLSWVVADIWCKAVNLEDDLTVKIGNLLQNVGMLFQFQDDYMDLRDDPDETGNLVRALLNEEQEKESLFGTLGPKGTVTLLPIMQRHAPLSLVRLLEWMEHENSQIREVSPPAADFWDSCMRISLSHIKV